MERSLTRAAEILEQYAESLRDPCSNAEDGDFSCEDCPAGRAVCVAEHAEIVHAAAVVRSAVSARGESYREIGALHRTRDGILHATTMPGFGMELHSVIPIFVKDGGKSET